MTQVETAGWVTVVGEALIDLVPAVEDGFFEARPGGSPANVAVGLARLDVPVRLAARLADDVFGRRLRAHQATNGVNLDFAVPAHEPTSLAIISLGPRGGPEYDFRVTGTADWQWTDPELASIPDDGVLAVHTGSLATILPPGAAAILRMVERARQSATITYDPNCRPLLMGAPDEVRGQVERLVGLSDVVKASAEDLDWLLPGRAPADVAREWLQRDCGLVAVTLGAEGVVASAPGTGPVWRPSPSLEVVDTVGAGDAFMSALLAALYRRNLLGAARREQLRALDREALVEILDQAVLAASLTCTRRGADPPTLAELNARGAGAGPATLL